MYKTSAKVSVDKRQTSYATFMVKIHQVLQDVHYDISCRLYQHTPSNMALFLIMPEQ